MPKKINVPLGRNSYPIYLGSGSHNQLPQYFHRHDLGNRVVIITQKPVWKKWGKTMRVLLENASVKVDVYMPPARQASEQMKSLDSIRPILKKVTKASATGERVFILGFGGGVVGDVSGFVASIYKRGIPCVHVPTTLTAQVDSSIGGKTGLDLPEGKNLIGSFYQPSFVLVDPLFLKSLDQKTFSDGMAEVIKYALISHPRLYDILAKNISAIIKCETNIMERIIGACAQIKADIVGKDERDTKGFRAVLNFGHTFGHALESATKFKGYTHGEAVALGMIFALHLSSRVKLMQNASLLGRVKSLLHDYGLPTKLKAKVNVKHVLKALKYDKKRQAGKNQFVLLKDIGKTSLMNDVNENTLLSLIAETTNQKIKKAGKSGFSFWSFFKKNKPAQAVAGTEIKLSNGRPQRRRPRTANSRSVPKRVSSQGKAPNLTSPTPVAAGAAITSSVTVDSANAIGKVETYFAKINVAIVRIQDKEVKLNDRIRIQGEKSRLNMQIRSMQINRKPVEVAKKGDVIGLRVPRRVRGGDSVFEN